MKTSLTALAAILLTVGMAHAQDSAAAKPDEAATKLLIANERALQDAVGKADKSAFESLVLLSDGFWTMRDGFLLMRQLADTLEVFKLTKWDIANPRVTWLSDRELHVDRDGNAVRSARATDAVRRHHMDQTQRKVARRLSPADRGRESRRALTHRRAGTICGAPNGS